MKKSPTVNSRVGNLFTTISGTILLIYFISTRTALKKFANVING